MQTQARCSITRWSRWVSSNRGALVHACLPAHWLSPSPLITLSACVQVTEAEQCVMKVEVLQESSSTGHKFKLHRIMVKKKQTGLATRL